MQKKITESKQTKKQKEAVKLYGVDVADVITSRFPESKKIEKQSTEFSIYTELTGNLGTKKDLAIIISLKPEVLYSYDEDLALKEYDRVFSNAKDYLDMQGINISEYSIKVIPVVFQKRYINN